MADSIPRSALALSSDPAEDAERAADYLIRRASELAESRCWQGERKPPLRCAAAGPLVRRIASERLYRVPVHAIEGLVAWADGHPVELLSSTPSARRVLSLQARAARCVSLLPETAPCAPHANGFEFAVHDLCHLGKFVHPEHHEEQVGFFSSVETALASPAWVRLDRELDETFRADFEHVVADMNGSAVFLFAALKMKLKMAARRNVAARDGSRAPLGGSLTPAETAAYRDFLDQMLAAFDFDAKVAAAAVDISTRRDNHEAAYTLLDHFRGRGQSILRSAAKIS